MENNGSELPQRQNERTLLTLSVQGFGRNKIGAVAEGFWRAVEESDGEVAGGSDGGGDREHPNEAYELAFGREEGGRGLAKEGKGAGRGAVLAGFVLSRSLLRH